MGAFAFGVDSFGYQLFSGTCFSNNQDGRIALRNLWDEVKHILHGRGLADDVIEASDFL